jgi:hypothetical protein
MTPIRTKAREAMKKALMKRFSHRVIECFF